MKQRTFGFSFVELMVVISIVGILLTIVTVNFQEVRQQARDAQRQTDLQTISAALELYKLKYGEYPAGCNGATTGTTPNWSGQTGSSYACGSGNQYIVNLAPEFIPELPRDPRLNGDDTGYVYTTNGERSVYKLMALNTVETETVGEGHELFRCGQDFDVLNVSCSGTGSGINAITRCQNSPSYEDGEICERSPDSSTQASPEVNLVCTLPGNFENTYAISGGFSSNNRGNTSNPELGEEFDTEIVRCS